MNKDNENQLSCDDLCSKIINQLNQIQTIHERSITAFEGMNVNNNFTLLNNTFLVQKLNAEILRASYQLAELEGVLSDLKELHAIAGREGYFSLVDFETSNLFLKNILRICSYDWPGNASQSPFSNLSYWIMPYLYSCEVKGKEFLDCVFYYEGIMMITVGGYSFQLIQYRLFLLLGKLMEL